MKFGRTPVVSGKAARLLEPGVMGAGIEYAEHTPAYPEMRKVTKLRKVGGRLAVYGYREAPTPGATPAQAARQLKWAHIVNPGSFSVPQVANHPMSGESGLTHATSLCGIPVVTNGYASDFTPAELELCPLCAERN